MFAFSERRPTRAATQNGAIAQLGERVLCKHEVVGSIPSGSTSFGSRQGSERIKVSPSCECV